MDESHKRKIQIMKGLFKTLFEIYPPDDQNNLLKVAEMIMSMQLFYLDMFVEEDKQKFFLDQVHNKVMDSLSSLKAAKMVVGAYLGQQERNGEF